CHDRRRISSCRSGEGEDRHVRQVYFVTTDWVEKMVSETEGLDEHTKHKAGFYVKQITAALSPTNFIATNPQLYRETIATRGANLVRGMKML
ncbi:hypothetical protein ACC698_37535, partial [Rhizobium johnstonii]